MAEDRYAESFFLKKRRFPGAVGIAVITSYEAVAFVLIGRLVAATDGTGLLG